MTIDVTERSNARVAIDEITVRLSEMVAEQMDLRPEQIRPGSHLEHDLEMDSLGRVEFQMAIEEEYGLELADEQVETIQTIGDAASTVAAALRERTADDARGSTP
jgi:acyl carrier protein